MAKYTRRGPNVWVVRYRGRFSIKEAGVAGHLVPPIPQRVAVLIARQFARANRSELIVQGQDGRIRARDSHGSDPVRFKG